MHRRSWAIRGLAASGLLGLGLLVAQGGIPWSWAQATPDPATQIEQLAERFLLQIGPAVPGVASPPPTAHLILGQAPPDFPLSVPVPPGGQIVGSLVRTGGPFGTSEAVALDVPGTPTDITQFMTTALGAQGWSHQASGLSSLPTSGGFQPGPSLASMTFCQADSPGYLTLMVRPVADGPADVRLMAYLAIPTAAAGSGPSPLNPCTASTGGLLGASQPNPLPQLIPPTGLALQTNGSSGNESGWVSSAVAQTSMAPADLAASFSPQLSAAGWTPLVSDSAASAAWSEWALSTPAGWQGVLVVTTVPGSGVAALTLRAYATSGDAPGSGTGSWVVTSSGGEVMAPISGYGGSAP